jgi:hypothetical protein
MSPTKPAQNKPAPKSWREMLPVHGGWRGRHSTADRKSLEEVGDRWFPPARKTFIRLADLERTPELPARLRVSELKEYGIVVLLHVDLRRLGTPWLKPGLYRFIGSDGRLYVLEVKPGIKGHDQTSWLYQPAVRVPARGVSR